MRVAEEVIDFENAPAVKRELLRAQASGDFTVDLSDVKRADSAALSVQLSARRKAEALGGRLAIEGLPADLKTLARLYGVEEILGLPVEKTTER
ncbi:STAS domain-containing protein [Sutterella seckii]|uniref:STAS domain-containing protein n=1 Tax=Sutterella seckii TaxID=1944635 RepID=A0AAI9SAX8_9BURK|nr:STAS domain-containing protein [Sutterella seckii]KAB7650589.1 STAS domain-containing protein [Sutterella seckii]